MDWHELAVSTTTTRTLDKEARAGLPNTTEAEAAGGTTMNPMTIMKGQKNLRFATAPALAGRATKGRTKYDEHFDRLLANPEEALRMPEDEFAAMKKAMQRFLDNRGLKGKVLIRQYKDRLNRTYLLWFKLGDQE